MTHYTAGVILALGLVICTTACLGIDIKNNCALLKVTAIGGCDKHGACGVQFEDGSFDKAYFPVVGGSEKVCR